MPLPVLQAFAGYRSVEVRVTEQPVNCSLFFTSTRVLYDPYLWSLMREGGRVENNFWVLEFEKRENPDFDCYEVLERHWRFLWTHSTSLAAWLGPEGHDYSRRTNMFRRQLTKLAQDNGART